jgi:hypothetical protein
MRRLQLATIILLLLPGCQAAVVRDHAAQLSGSIPDLYYEQVLDNIAMSIARPDALPYFGISTQATSANARLISAGYTPTLSFITAAGAFFDRWLFSGQTIPVSAAAQNQGSIQITPILDPDKLVLLGGAFHVLGGFQTLPGIEARALTCYYNAQRGCNCQGTQNPNSPTGLVQLVYYQDMLANLSTQRWFGTSTSKLRVPKDACYVGHYCGLYVWVDQSHLDDLKEATLVLLDIASAELNSLNLGDRPKPKAGAPGAAPPGQEVVPSYRTPRQQLLPSAPPYLAPSI